MKFFIPFLLTTFYGTACYSQKKEAVNLVTINITGKVIDAITNEALEYATITLIDAASKKM